MGKIESSLGIIGSIFGGSQRDIFQGDLMRSVGTGLAPEDKGGRNRWRPNGHTVASQINLACFSGSAPSKEWFVVARDHHSRSRYGNQRP